VQVAVAESRQLAFREGLQSTSGMATTRAMGSTVEGNSVQRRTDMMIDKLEPSTDKNLYVLPEVLSARNQSWEAAFPAYALQSGLLNDETLLSSPSSVKLALNGDVSNTDSTKTSQAEPATEASQQQATGQDQDDAQELARKQALHLAAAREATKEHVASSSAMPSRGQFGFSKQLQMTAAKRHEASTKTAA
jgi:hypothetical protein